MMRLPFSVAYFPRVAPRLAEPAAIPFWLFLLNLSCGWCSEWGYAPFPADR